MSFMLRDFVSPISVPHMLILAYHKPRKIITLKKKKLITKVLLHESVNTYCPQGQSSNHVVKRPLLHPSWNHILGLLLVALYSFFNFSRKRTGISIKYIFSKLFHIRLSIERYQI